MKTGLGSQRDEMSSPQSGTDFRGGADTQATLLGADDLVVGAIIAAKYRVERVIGAGAMGIVIAARHLELDETVALKFIQPEMQKVPGVLSRFAREAKACVRIKSDHVAKVLDVGIAERLGPYIVMEYLEGRDLAQVLAQNGPVSVRRATEYVMQACEALALAHSMGITHRDIKPGNLFLTRRGDFELIKVLDFGISKAALTGRIFGDDVSLVETSGMMGTPLYMSPEQIRATSEVDQRSDIWSLGVALYELLSGESAFFADSVMQVCALVLESAPVSLLSHRPALPVALQAVVERCLQKNPDQRFQNVAELAQALAPFAPSRARVHADRAASVLRKPSRDSAIDLSLNLPGGHPDLQSSALDSAPAPETPTHISASASARGQAKKSAALEPSLGPLVRSDYALSVAGPASQRRRRTVFGSAAALCVALAAFGWLLSSKGNQQGAQVNPTEQARPEPSGRQQAESGELERARAASAGPPSSELPAPAPELASEPAAPARAGAGAQKRAKPQKAAKVRNTSSRSEAPPARVPAEPRTATTPPAAAPHAGAPAGNAKSRVRLIDADEHVRLLH